MSQDIEHAVSPELGKYDFDGQCAPHQEGFYATKRVGTFSLGIFEWEAKKGYRGKHNIPLKPSHLKRGPVLVRVKGDCANPGPAYEEARDRCRVLNEKPKGIIPRRRDLPERDFE